MQDLQTLGAVLAQTNLFGKKNPAEGLAIVAMCQQKRISWLDFMQTFHLIQGVVSKKTDAILADLRRAGGKHKPLCRTPEKAEAVFTNADGDSYTSTVTWEECLQEPFVYIGLEKDVVAMLAAGKRPQLKSKYSTPRARMQMLWARCVSDGVRVVAPECVQGIYTPEEASDFAPEQSAPAAPTPIQPVAVSPSPVTEPVQASDIDVCPVGTLKGQRWDSMQTPVLQQALAATGPFITVEMKDRIREILKSRESGAVEAEAEEVSNG